MSELRVLEAQSSQVGRENWTVCERMLMHDLLELAEKTPALRKLLDFYSIGYLPDGRFTMALPRLGVIEKTGHTVGKAVKVSKKR